MSGKLCRGPSKAFLESGNTPKPLQTKLSTTNVHSNGEEDLCFRPLFSESKERDFAGPDRRQKLVVFHSSGIYQLNPSNGSYSQVSSEGWSRVKAVAYDNDNTIYIFHDGGIFKMDVETSTYTTLSDEGWWATTAAVYAQGNLIVFHADGIYRVSIRNGSYERISNEGWSRAKAVAYDSDNTISVFHDGGIFQVRVDNGSYKTLSWRGWSATTGAVYARNSLIVFSADGIYRVNAGNGSYARISNEGWSRVRAVAYDDDNAIIVFHAGGIFQVSVENGSYTMLSREGWSSTKAAVHTRGNVLVHGQHPHALPATHKREAKSRGISLAAVLLIVVFAWAEYGPEVEFKWKVLRSCLAVASVFRLAISYRPPTEKSRPTAASHRNGTRSISSESNEHEFESQPDDPVRACSVPSDGNIWRANTKSALSFDTEGALVKGLVMLRPTHEPWREDMGNYRYSWHFSGRRRLWEIRVQLRFKHVPKSDLWIGIEMRYIPFTPSAWLLYLKTLILKGMSVAIGGEIYQTPGEDPTAVDGEPEPPTLVFPLWAIDQFHVANPGEEPDLSGDLEGIGTRRTSGLANYIQALKSELSNISTEKVYTFCLWGISTFFDAIHWEAKFAGFKFDPSQLCGNPPVYLAMYSLPGVNPGDSDRRHLISRKEYIFKVAIWNVSKPYDEAEVKSMVEVGNQAEVAESEMKLKAKSRSRGDCISCCAQRS